MVTAESCRVKSMQAFECYYLAQELLGRRHLDINDGNLKTYV